MLIAGWGMLGLLLGGVVALLAPRLLSPRPLGRWPVRCRACRQPLAWGDVLPVVGFLRQRGRCRSCGWPLPWWEPLLAVATAGLFGLLADQVGWGPRLWVLSLWSVLLLLALCTDLLARRLPNRLLVPWMGLALLAAALGWGPPLLLAVLGGLAAGGSLLLLAWVGERLLRRSPVLGMGDVKLAVVIGLLVGLPQVYHALFLGALLGALGGLFYLWRTRSLASTFPYAPALVGGAWVVLVFASPW